jgi:hypothetical protein
MTTRRFGEPEANIVADLIADVLDAPTDISIIATVAQKAQSHCDAFPVYAKLGREWRGRDVSKGRRTEFVRSRIVAVSFKITPS